MRKVVGLGRVAVAWTAAAASVSAQPGSQSVTVDADDIGGMVAGPNGPEAGVWVIAETDELPTKFRKIVVTDEQGRYLLPDLPAANYVLWVRGYGLVDSPRVRVVARASRRIAGGHRARRTRRRAGLSRELLVLADRAAARGAVPGHGRERQRHRGGSADAAPLDQYDQDRLQRLPPARQSRDTRVSARLGHVRVVVRRVGPPHAGRAGRHGDDQRDQRTRAPTRADDVRGLDGPDRGRRGAAGAAAPAGHRTQSRADALGVGRARDVCARRAVDRQAQPTRECQRSDLRRRLGQRRLPDSRSEHPYGNGSADSRRRPDDSAGQTPSHAAAIAVLGQTSLTGTTLRSRIMRRWTAKGASGCRRGFVGPRISRTSAATIHRPRSRLKSRASGRCSTTTRRPSRSIRSTSASTRTTCSSRPTPTRRSTATACSAARSAGSTREFSTRRATRRPRRAGACRTTTSTATARSRQASTATCSSTSGGRAASSPACEFRPASSTA